MADRIDPRLAPLFKRLGFLPGEAELRTKGMQLLDLIGAVDPVQGIHRGMAASGRAFDPSRPAEERRAAAIEAALETAGPVMGVGMGRLAMQPAKRVLVENLTLGGLPDDFDPRVNDDLFPSGPDVDESDFLLDRELAWDRAMRDPQVDEWEAVLAEEANAGGDTFGDGLPDGFDPNAMDPVVDPDADPLADIGDPENWDDFLLSAPEPSELVPTVGRAAISLEQPRYGSYDEVLANLRRLGAKNPEIEMSGIKSLEGVQGPITKDMVEAAVAGDNALEVARLGAGSSDKPQYEMYFTPGGENYREVIIRQPWRAGSEQFWPSHFAGAGTNQLVHYRAADFPVVGSGDTPLGKSFHIGEIQSDWAQNRTARNREIALANMSPEDAGAWFEKNVREPLFRYEALRQEKDKIQAELNKFGDAYRGTDWYDEKVSRLEEVYGQLDDARGVRDNAFNKSDEFQLYFKDVSEMGDYPVWERNNTPAPDPLPDNAVVRDTNEVVRLALRQALVDAAKSDTQYVTLGTGDMAAEMTGGKVSGQKEFYDRIVPRQLKELFKRLGREYEIEMPEIMELGILTEEDLGMGYNDRVRSVPGFVMTDELRRAILDNGMSMFRYGGLV